MTRVVLDTNIVLDYLSATRPSHLDAVNLLECILSSEDVAAVIPAGSIKDAYYILCRHYRDEKIVRSRLDEFRRLVEVAELTIPVLDAAFSSDEPDLEDAIVRAAAELLGAKAIVTRDASAYARSSVPSMDARTFCAQQA
ncbi:type II toxin-antitoxin system VapC family toxin [Thermophilibacter sp.]